MALRPCVLYPFRQKMSCLRLKGLHPCLFTRLKNQAPKKQVHLFGISRMKGLPAG
jgi:hypothetical protein